MAKKTTKKQEEEKALPKELPSGPTVTVIKTAQASKLSPRGDGLITYQIGRCDDALMVRISGNESSGRYSKEWVSVEKIRNALSKVSKAAESFKAALLLRAAWKGKSSCNGGFGAAILLGENLLIREDNPKKKSMLKLSSPDAIEVWEKKLLAEEVPNDAEIVPLHPPKPQPFFKKKDMESEGGDEPEENPEVDPEEKDPEPKGNADIDPEEKDPES